MKRILISADHGLAVFYFLQSDVVSTLLVAGVEVVVLTEDETCDLIRSKFGQPGLTIEGLRLDQVQAYTRQVSPAQQWWLDFLRRAGASYRINRSVVDAYIEQVKSEAHARRRRFFPVMEGVAGVLRHSRPRARRSYAIKNLTYPGFTPTCSKSTSPTW